MISSGIIELDLHGLRSQEAKKKIDAVLREAGANVYRIRIIHGYHGGTGIRAMIWEEYRFGREERVLRVVSGVNEGITELILREY